MMSQLEFETAHFTAICLAHILFHIGSITESVTFLEPRQSPCEPCRLSHDEVEENVDVSVRVLQLTYLYNLSRMVRRLRSTIADFTLGYLYTWNRMPSFLYMSLNNLFKYSLPVNVRTRIGRLLRGLEYFGLSKINRNVDATVVSVLDLVGTICRNFKKTSFPFNRYM